MTISLTERARNRRLIALQALQMRRAGMDSGVAVLADRVHAAQPVFRSTRVDMTSNILLAA